MRVCDLQYLPRGATQLLPSAALAAVAVYTSAIVLTPCPEKPQPPPLRNVLLQTGDIVQAGQNTYPR
jgi:hypothetical protein